MYVTGDGEKCKGSVSLCLSEVKMGLSLQHMGKSFEGAKTILPL